MGLRWGVLLGTRAAKEAGFFSSFVGEWTKHVPGSGMQEKPGCRSGLGAPAIIFWNDVDATLGTNIGPKRGPKTSWIFECFLEDLGGATLV